MREYSKFYIGGKWTDPAAAQTFDVVNPATEEIAGRVARGSAADVDLAVAAARQAFPAWAATPSWIGWRYCARSAPNTTGAAGISPPR